MAKGLSKGDVLKIVNRYIGVSGGYLGDFNYRTHVEFYPEFCDLDINPDRFMGTTRQRFIAILSSAAPADQRKILQGVLKRFPAEGNESRLTVLPELREMLGRIEASGPVPSVKPRITSAVVQLAIEDAEALLRNTGATSGVDRVHTALHGYLIAVCDDAGILYGKDPSLTELYKLIRDKHPKLSPSGPRANDIAQLLKSLTTVFDLLNPLRNRASLAHPNPSLLDAPEAWLVINTARSLLHYLDAKLA